MGSEDRVNERRRWVRDVLDAAALSRSGVTVLHALSGPGRDGDIDHVIVTESGVTVLTVDDDARWWARRRLRVRRLRSLEVRLHAVCAALASCGRDDVPVSSALCDDESVDALVARLMDGDDAAHDSGADGAPGVAGDGARLSWDDIRMVHAILASAFCVRGGAVGMPPAGAAPLLGRQLTVADILAAAPKRGGFGRVIGR